MYEPAVTGTVVAKSDCQYDLLTMSTSQEPPLGEPVRRLYPNAKVVLIAWVVVVIALAVVVFFQTSEGEGFDDLARFIALILAAIALAGIALIGLLIRQFITTPSSQTLAAVIGPPAIAALSIGVIQIVG